MQYERATLASRRTGFRIEQHARVIDANNGCAPPEPLAFTASSSNNSDALAMDIVDLFSSPLERDALFADLDMTCAAFSDTTSPSSTLSSAAASTTPGTVGHTSSGTESEPTAEPEPPSLSHSHNHSAVNNQATAIATIKDDDPAEVRRKRNRESMRRVRLRKRDAKLTTQQTVDALETQLQQLITQNARAATQLERLAHVHTDPTTIKASDSRAITDATDAAPTYAQLLSETAALSFANKSLRDRVQTHHVLNATLVRMLNDEQLAPQAVGSVDTQQQHVEDAQQADVAMLKPLLSWLTPSALDALIATATERIVANRQVVASLVPLAYSALGWSDQRVVHNRMARYVLRKTFACEQLEALALRTWGAITDIQQLSRVMRWANGMRVVQWLSEDAAVVTRELTIPRGGGDTDDDVPTKFRFTLLVYRTQTADGGWVMGTLNLNVYGTTVDECLATDDPTYKSGVQAYTMYGWTFTPANDDGSGCIVELAGLTGNGTNAYAHNVLMEMITVVLLWENALVAPIKLLRT